MYEQSGHFAQNLTAMVRKQAPLVSANAATMSEHRPVGGTE